MRLAAILILHLFLSLSAKTQRLSLIVPNANTSCNSTVDIPIKIKGFSQLLSLQGSIGWDASKLSFQSISSYGPTSLGLSSGNFGTNGANSGYLTFSWNDADMSGESLADSSMIFTIRFYVLSNFNTNSTVQLLNSPTILEAIDLNFNSVAIETVSGVVNISCSNLSNLGLFLASTSANCNTVVDIPVKVKAFENIKSLQGSLSWDFNKLQFQSIVNFGHSALSISNSNFSFSNITNGKLSFTWNSNNSSGNTLTDSTVLFTIRFNVLNNGAYNSLALLSFDSSPSWAASNITSSSLSVLTTNGQVAISCNPISNFKLILPTISASCSTNYIDVPIKVNGFSNILSFQGSIGWDPTKLNFQSISSFGISSLGISSSNFGNQSTSNGRLTFSWNDNDLTGESIPDSSILFVIRFNIISTSSVLTTIQILNSPTMLEVVDVGYNNIAPQILNGGVNIICTTSAVSFILPTLNVACKTFVEVPVKVKDFIGLLSYQGSINWDTGKLKLRSLSNYGPSTLNLNSTNFGMSDTSSGKISFSWNDADLSGETLSDSTVLFSLYFYIEENAANNSLIQFSNSPTQIESIKIGLFPLQTLLINGSVNVTCQLSNSIQLLIPNVTASCNSTIDVPIRVKNFNQVLSMQGSIGWDYTKLEFQQLVGLNIPSNLNLSSANFGLTNTSNGKLTFAWNDADLNGENLPDSSIVFAMRFINRAVNGTISAITVGSSPTPIEFINTSFQPVNYSIVNGSCQTNCVNNTQLQVKFFLEGFYIGADQMNATLYNLGISADQTATDSVVVNLWNQFDLNNPNPNFRLNGILHSNGTMNFTLPPSTLGNNYYISLNHRNSIETWSSKAIMFSSQTNYDFSNSLTKAYAEFNTASMKTVEPGHYALFGGDANKDGTVDGLDMNIVDNNTIAGAFGYDNSDANGDGASDGLDMNIVDNNTVLGLFMSRPY